MSEELKKQYEKETGMYWAHETILWAEWLESKLKAVESYKANFLWPHEDDSLESLGYEFANAKTEEYQKEIWKTITDKIDELKSKLKAVEGLLEIAVCPNHCNNGAIQVADDDWEQCEWCGVKNELKKQ